jgi:prepilin-type N-terminal cleavage/methylation domain-containing protein
MKTHRGKAGFTMVELLVAVAIALLVTVGLYELYVTYVRAYVAQDRALETQQAARVAIDTLTQDLIRAGYKVDANASPITYAANSAIEVQVFNETDNVQERIRYTLNGANELVRAVYRFNGTQWIAQANSGVLVEHLYPNDRNGDSDTADPGEGPALAFRYVTAGAISGTVPGSFPASLDVSTPKDLDPTTDPNDFDAGSSSDPTSLRDIRQVQVELTVRSRQVDPVTGAFLYRTLRADVKPRNAGLMATIKDNSPPAVPTGLSSRDQGDCARLYLSWNNNSEPDLAGYVLYWGRFDPSVGEWEGTVNVDKTVAHSTGSPYMLGGLVDDYPYYVAIAAFDYSGNTSAATSPIFYDVATVGNPDTRPNISDPETAPTAFVGSAGENRVTLDWQAVPEPDVIGYRVFRKLGGNFTTTELSAIASTDGGNLGALPANVKLVASETAGPVTQTATGFRYVDTNTDPTNGLEGCRDYYYAVAAVKGCALPPTGVARPMTTYSSALFSRTGPLRPTDTQKPIMATGTQMLTAFPSYLRNYLTLTAPQPTLPENVDVTHMIVAYRTGAAGSGAYPTIAVDPATGTASTNGTWLDCYSTSYGPGTRLPGQPGDLTHTGSPCAGGYHLNPSVTYFYTAVAVDACGNVSDPATTEGLVEATQCGDEDTPGHPAVGNPPRVGGVHATSERGFTLGQSNATLGWDRIDDSFNQIRDHAGFYIFRRQGAVNGTPPTDPVLADRPDPAKGFIAGNVTSTVYAGLAERTVQKVKVLAVDCETITKETPSYSFLTGRYSAAPPQDFNSRASETLIFYPGTILNPDLSTKVLGQYQNIVEFSALNSFNANATLPGEVITLNTLTFDWVTPNRGIGSDRLLRTVVINNGVSTVTITPSRPLSSGQTLDVQALAPGTGIKANVRTTFILTFVNSATLDSRKASMKGLRIEALAQYVPPTRRGTDVSPLYVHDAAQVANARFTVQPAIAPEVLYAFDSIGNPWCPWFSAVEWPNTPNKYTQCPTDPTLMFVDMDFWVGYRDNANKGIKKVSIFWTTSALTQSTPPPLADTLPASLPGFTQAVMCDSSTGIPEYCAADAFGGADVFGIGLLPRQATRRIWYVVVVEDLAGNFGVGPLQDSGTGATFWYDQ